MTPVTIAVPVFVIIAFVPDTLKKIAERKRLIRKHENCSIRILIRTVPLRLLLLRESTLHVHTVRKRITRRRSVSFGTVRGGTRNQVETPPQSPNQGNAAVVDAIPAGGLGQILAAVIAKKAGV